METVDIVVYVIFALVCLYVIRAEKIDLQCKDSDGTECGPLTGRAYAYGAPLDGDSKEELLNKVRITARYDVNSIHWRRCFVVATISSLLIGFIQQNRIPDYRTFLINFLIVYILTYLAYVLFQQMVTYKALAQMDRIIEALQEV